MSAPRPPFLLHHLAQIEAHHRFLIALIVGLAALAAGWHLRLPVRIIVAWDTYALTLLAMAWSRIVSSKPATTVQLAKLTHTDRRVLSLLVTAAACASLTAVAFLLGTAKGLQGTQLVTHVCMAVGTVILSWLVLHTVFALHYAFLYYTPENPDHTPRDPGGLLFPEQEIEPDYTDFAYFSFIIGMTSQVSDVQIAARHIRRWALLHGVVSFGFNTVVLALSINIVSGLL